MGYPNPPRRRLTSVDLDDVQYITEDRVRKLARKLTAEQWELGAEWYYLAHGIARNFARMYGSTIEKAAGVIAALSPRITWEQNIEGAREVLEHGDDAQFGALMANLGKAINIAGAFDPEDILGGRKVRSFYRNILDPDGSMDVTLDGWMVYALDLPGETPHKYLERRGVYDAISDGFRTVADELGVRPHQLQAAIWVAVRNGKDETK